MLINLRNALMAGKRLPYDAEVEYLESTGTQWIDTGVNADSNMSVMLDMQSTQTSATYGFMGAIKNSSTRYHFTCDTVEQMALRYGNSNNIGGKNTALQRSTYYVDSVAKKFYSGGTETSFSSIPAFDCETNFGLFARLGVAFSAVSARVYSCKIWQGSRLVRDFIPVRVGTVGYLYDRVTGKLFGNAGTGDFVVGPDVVPVEYIESHGTEYIDTGVIPDDATGVEVVHTICPDNGTDNIIFGARQDSRNTRYWSDVDWGALNSLGWGFNTYSNNRERFALASSDVGRVVTNSLNYMNNRAGKIDGVTYDSSLQSKTLATINRSIYLFCANNQGAPDVGGVFRVYSAKTSKGQTLANNFIPVRVGTDATSWEGAMMDTLTRRIYRNAGTGAFTYGNDLKYPIPA